MASVCMAVMARANSHVCPKTDFDLISGHCRHERPARPLQTNPVHFPSLPSRCTQLCALPLYSLASRRDVTVYEVVAEFEPRPESSTDAAASDSDGTAVGAVGGGPGGRRLGLNPLGPNNVLVVMMGFISNLNREIFPACDTACVLVRWWRHAPLIHPPYSHAHALAHALCTRPLCTPSAHAARPVGTLCAHTKCALPPRTPSPHSLCVHSLCALPLRTLPLPTRTHSPPPLCMPITHLSGPTLGLQPQRELPVPGQQQWGIFPGQVHQHSGEDPAGHVRDPNCYPPPCSTCIALMLSADCCTLATPALRFGWRLLHTCPHQ